ncbi:hypothetical protein HZH66_014305 [Vespula vulgaris]|uniref:Uncharacterized protein n=1 Tax=Vespula vulgaris TaxID=7454 RepID=A0A834MRF7_VESVU|nr:hypothetical protein HZH66_014305 [Vespula vulgaris]
MSADARHHVGKNTNKRRKDPTTVVAITERNSICKSRKQKSKVTEAEEEEEEEAEEAMEWRRQGTPDILDGPMPQQVSTNPGPPLALSDQPAARRLA